MAAKPRLCLERKMRVLCSLAKPRSCMFMACIVSGLPGDCCETVDGILPPASFNPSYSSPYLLN